jgi:hypothetical protein
MLDRSPGSGKDHIGYQSLTQAALKSVVRTALEKAAKLEHLPGDHHFYVTFRNTLIPRDGTTSVIYVDDAAISAVPVTPDGKFEER